MKNNLCKCILGMFFVLITVSCGDKQGGKNLFSNWNNSINKDTGKKINTGVVELNLSQNKFNNNETFAIVASATGYDKTICSISADINGEQSSGTITNVSKSNIATKDFINLFRVFYFEDPVAASSLLNTGKAFAICNVVLLKSNYKYQKSSDTLTLCPINSINPADCYYFK
ncbi:hypothetical protein [Fluviispira vulneris]|uniref:hypothetical protein n=1 Tax=Fluviispira vulneris TaxID=2763012 RepID=UPI0016447EB9|nr:hypothetical protein [Fluviispira vulneris]